MKTCSNCKTSKPLDAFSKKGKGLQPWCKDCNKARSRKYYAENREKHLAVVSERSRLRREANKELYCQYLASHPCIDCGEPDIIVLEPDHVGEKSQNLSEMIHGGSSWSRILEELAECEIVCRNCHARRTHSRYENGTYKTRYAGV